MPELHSKYIVEQIEAGLHERVCHLAAQHGTTPRLHILCDNRDYQPSAKYIALKERVGARLGIAVESFFEDDIAGLYNRLAAANERDDVHGIIVQFPLKHRDQEEEVVAQIAPEKDVDGLGSKGVYKPATPVAALKLLEGYDIGYADRSVAVLGQGRLVGRPVLHLMQAAGALEATGFDEHSDRLEIIQALNQAEIIISAMGRPGVVSPALFDDVSIPRVLLDAGTAEGDGLVRGDVSDELRKRGLEYGWLITPEIGGIGPLTVRTLLSNVVGATEARVIV